MADSNRRLAVVTGASSGIGYELAKQFAEHSYDLVIAAEDAGLVEAQQAFEGLGISVKSVRVDLAKPDGVEQLYTAIKEMGRPVDAIAINAGIGVGGDFARETSLNTELQMVDLNCRSTVHLAKRVLADMVERGEGKVLFTSSIAATMPAPFEAVYGATKAFVFSFSEALRNELKDTNITVTALMPGPTETNFFHRADMDDTKAGTDEKDDAAKVARQGFEAMIAGKDHLVAGSFTNKVQAVVAKLIPPTTSAEAHRSLSEPGSGKK